jgi:hypothetical protein
MIMYESSTRDNSLTRHICDVYRSILKDDLVGIIMCGGAGKSDGQDYEGADIDYVAVITRIDAGTLLGVSQSQQVLESEFKARPSHTVITKKELLSANRFYKDMDGKAVQALIEAQEQDLAGIELNAIPKFSLEEIRDFSKANLPVLQALLRKVVARSAPDPSEADKVMMAKIALIVQKMQKQAAGAIDPTEPWEGRDQLQDMKLNPTKYDQVAVRGTMLRFIES